MNETTNNVFVNRGRFSAFPVSIFRDVTLLAFKNDVNEYSVEFD